MTSSAFDAVGISQNENQHSLPTKGGYREIAFHQISTGIFPTSGVPGWRGTIWEEMVMCSFETNESRGGLFVWRHKQAIERSTLSIRRSQQRNFARPSWPFERACERAFALL
jgi:hypothetical protein